MSKCYEWKKVRRKSSDKPWISDAVRAQINKGKEYSENKVEVSSGRGSIKA